MRWEIIFIFPQVERVLPTWLRLPILIKNAEDGCFSEVRNLDPSLVQKLKENNIENCSPGLY